MAEKIKIGAVTIGQSPRVDVAPDFEAALGIGAELIQAGALDGLSLDEVKELAPKAGDYILVTRMRDGTEVKVAERCIHQRMLGAIRKLEEAGVRLIALFCTGEFPDLDSRCPILKPDGLLIRLVPAIAGKGKLGVILPSEDQKEAMGRKWGKTGLAFEMEAASPYTGTEEDFRRAARNIREKDIDLIVLDCIGYSREMKRIIKEESGKPVILPRTLLGRVAGEILDGGV